MFADNTRTGQEWAWKDSNLQPDDYESPALTIELQALVSRYSITPCRCPTAVNASTARSSCSWVCAALTCTRMRASPFGTTG